MTMASKLKRVEWNVLTSFLSVCHTSSLIKSAKLMGVSRSTMSERLSKLEEILEVDLLNREHKKVYVNEQGLYLAKYILPLVVLERFSLLPRDDTQSIQWISLEFPLRNYGQRLCSSLEYLIQKYQEKYPNILILPQSFDSYDVRPTQELEWQPSWTKVGSIQVKWETQLDLLPHHVNKIAGSWCIMSHSSKGLKAKISLLDLASLKVLLPRMPWVLLQQIASISENMRFSFEHISYDYCQFIHSMNAEDNYFIVNSLLINQENLPDEWQISAIENFPAAYLCLSSEGGHHITHEFIADCQEIFFKNNSNVIWETKTQLKHWHYMHQTMKTGSITTAAQQLYMSQSALSTQLKQLEKNLNNELLQRSMGIRKLIQTEAGKIFFEILEGLESISTYLAMQCELRTSDQKQKLIFGILPSIDTKSTFVRMIVNQVSDWLAHHPNIKLEIVEERHRYLVDALRSGNVHLAVIEADSPWVTHIPIHSPEEMGLVINPKLIDENITSLDWEDLKNIDLVLPRPGTGMRLIIDKHCLSLGVKLHPKIESDSLNINQYWIQEGKYATILPRSAVAQLLENKTLKFITLKPTLNRVLRLAYLNQRVLSATENSLLEFLLK